MYKRIKNIKIKFRKIINMHVEKKIQEICDEKKLNKLNL